MNLVEKIQEKKWYVWTDEDNWKKRSRKICQGKTCPRYDARGGSMHCGEFCGGWCRHDEYGENWDKAVIEVDDVLGLLEGYVAVPQKQLEERRNDLLESYAKERDEFEYGQACMIDEFLDETKALEFRKKLRDDGKRPTK